MPKRVPKQKKVNQVKDNSLMSVPDQITSKRSFPQILRQIAWCIIILISLLVRLWKIEYIPYANDADELAYIWAGQSLIEYGVPISWSSFAHTETQWQWVDMTSPTVEASADFPVQFVKPWFDHSFVLPIIFGGWSIMLGHEFPSIPPALLYRLPILLFAALNLVLIYQTAKKMFGEWPALFALLLVSFSPSFLLAQRMVVSENVLATGVLLAVFFFVHQRPVWTMVLATALAGLVKVPGLFIVPVISLALLAEKKYSDTCKYLIGVVSVVGGGYLLYGLAIDLGALTAAFTAQSSRLLGWSNPAFILSQPGFHTSVMLDLSYYVIGLLGLSVFFFQRDRNTRFMAGITLASFLTIWVTSAEQDMLGWYKIPLFCLLAINVAGAVKWLRSPQEGGSPQLTQTVPLVLTLLLLMIVVNNLGLVRSPSQPLPEANTLRVVVGLLLGLGLLMTQFQLPKKVSLIAYLVVAGMYIGQSFYIVDQLFPNSCMDRSCPTPTVTAVSTFKELFR